MLVGVPKEIKNNEYRVAMTPAGVQQLIEQGHQVLVETMAGDGSRFTDEQYARVGAKIVPTRPTPGARRWSSRSRNRSPSSTHCCAPTWCCSPTCTWRLRRS